MNRRGGRRIGETWRPRRPLSIAAGLLLSLAIGASVRADAAAVTARHGPPPIPIGALFQLPHALGCISEHSRDSCQRGRGLAGASGVAVAGRYVYVASSRSGAVAVFRRDPATGALHQLAGTAGCVSESGQDGCATGRGLSLAFSLTVSRDGRNLYVAGLDDVATFARNPRTGRLSQLPGGDGCIAEFPGDGCSPGRALNDVASVAVSPDGHNVYTASSANQVLGYGKSAVVTLTRDPSTGALSQAPGLAGCTNGDGGEGCQHGNALELAFSVVVAPDGRHVYVGSELSSAILSFERESDGSLRQIPFPGECTSQGGRDGCATGHGLAQVAGLAISPGGGYLYAGAARSSAAAALFLTSGTGGIDQLKRPYGCTTEHGLEGCATGRGLAGAGPVAVSPDGHSVYVGGLNSLVSFDREQSNGHIDQLPGPYGCLTEGQGQDGCAAGRGLAGVSSVAISPDSKWVYVASLPSQRNGVVAVFARARGSVRLRVRLSGVPRRCVRRPFRVSVVGSGALPIKSVHLALDGRVVARSGHSALMHRVNASRLKPRSHTLTATATDLTGRTRHVSRRFRRC
jgi:DNA-binding beta-propeller fold protein YncE